MYLCRELTDLCCPRSARPSAAATTPPSCTPTQDPPADGRAPLDLQPGHRADQPDQADIVTPTDSSHDSGSPARPARIGLDDRRRRSAHWPGLRNAYARPGDNAVGDAVDRSSGIDPSMTGDAFHPHRRLACGRPVDNLWTSGKPVVQADPCGRTAALPAHLSTGNAPLDHRRLTSPNAGYPQYPQHRRRLRFISLKRITKSSGLWIAGSAPVRHGGRTCFTESASPVAQPLPDSHRIKTFPAGGIA